MFGLMSGVANMAIAKFPNSAAAAAAAPRAAWHAQKRVFNSKLGTRATSRNMRFRLRIVAEGESSNNSVHATGIDSGSQQQQIQSQQSPTPVGMDVGGFGSEGRLSLETAGAHMQIEGSSSSSTDSKAVSSPNHSGQGDMNCLDSAINAAIVFAAGSFVLAKLLTVDHDYWHGWTLYEIVKYAPVHNWTAYEEALKSHPVLAKMVISGLVYSVGDWIAQCYEGKPIFEFSRRRVFRSGLVGFCLHGSLSHYYYHICEDLFPSQGWWVVPAKVLFDQTVWASIWNSIYFVLLGLLRLESPTSIMKELTATYWPLLTAGWKLWPFAHLITYGVIPVEQRLLWVDCVELIWVTILSMYSNEKSEARTLEASEEKSSNSIKS